MRIKYFINKNEIENLLNKLGYYDLEFNYFSEYARSYFYEGCLDTEYRIAIKIIDEETLEIWDCDYYEDNYVLVSLVKRNEIDEWVLVSE